jgi:hypothetical protein
VRQCPCDLTQLTRTGRSGLAPQIISGIFVAIFINSAKSESWTNCTTVGQKILPFFHDTPRGPCGIESKPKQALYRKAEMRAEIILGVMLGMGVSAADAASYIGVDGNRYSITLKGADSEFFPQSAGGEDLHFGERFGDLAGEAGYGTSTFSNKGALDNLHLTRLTADGFLYLPVFGAFNILATAGGAETNYGVSAYATNSYMVNGHTKISNADVPLSEGNEFDWRAGTGFSFGIDEFELRVLTRYQPLSMQHQAQNALSLDFGLNMYF